MCTYTICLAYIRMLDRMISLRISGRWGPHRAPPLRTFVSALLHVMTHFLIRQLRFDGSLSHPNVRRWGLRRPERSLPVSVKKTLLSCEPWQCDPAAETAIQPLIWSPDYYSNVYHLPEECFSFRRHWSLYIVAIFYPFSQFCEINVSLLSLQKQPNAAPNLFQRGVEYGKYALSAGRAPGCPRPAAGRKRLGARQDAGGCFQVHPPPTLKFVSPPPPPR